MKFNAPPVEERKTSIVEGPGGLPAIHIDNDLAECTIFLYGAHIASFKPKGTSEVLFMSPHSAFEKGVPIRGGIPVCFPWFGKHPHRDDLFLHGLVRTQVWKLERISTGEDKSTTLVLSTCDDETTRTIWPHRFAINLTVSVAHSLTVEIEVRNTDTESFTYEEAFHTYFSVDDVQQCRVEGLEGLQARNRLANEERYIQSGPVTVSDEFVRLFEKVNEDVVLKDSNDTRVIALHHDAFNQVLVWNPGQISGMANPEIAEAWNTFVCVEHANCLDALITLQPQEVHRSSIVISPEK
ncbi:D-hexose-6-phosphate mutarotase [Pleomorphochaeta sp. DL1XJH-081]|uniref:D-hexose-6-phosphate mutarotase n=1 Tax=Pleomorphochaeta sp. DL1XJH-081 TaxID=3409690 RepID=UPI003BB69EAA